MAPGLLFAVLVVLSFTFFIINRIALLDPFGTGDWHLVLKNLKYQVGSKTLLKANSRMLPEIFVLC